MPGKLRNIFFIVTFCVLLQACNGETGQEQEPGQGQPNILLIMADDLGYSDLGIYGSEIPTPNLDALAQNGMLLTEFYANATCSPTRSMLMSGMDNHLAGLGGMRQPPGEAYENQPGYFAYLNFRVASLADLMTDAGYNTYMTGKWHLGRDVYNGPRARGFKRSFISLDGAAHLGPWSWTGPVNADYRDGDELVNVGEDFYSTRFYSNRMIEYIESDRDDGKPFFAWLAYTAPHFPIQAPKESIARFDGWYDDGYEALYLSRFERQKELGLVDENMEPDDLEIFATRWDELSEEEKQFSAQRMQVYAGMVSDLDIYVGEVIDYLKEIDEFDNTFIMFMSDNGAEPGRRDLSETYQQHVGTAYDHSLENIGAGNSWIMVGPEWATVSSSPSRDHKFTSFEGGYHVPAFAHYPGLIDGGTRSDGLGTVMDLMPTFLALAGTQHPGTLYRDQEILPITSKSLLPILEGEASEVHDESEVIGWEIHGYDVRAIRQGDWKVVWDQDYEGPMLFDLSENNLERSDLANELPQKLEEMVKLWDQYVEDNDVIYQQ
jgi:arylsulfatase A-like enzyme